MFKKGILSLVIILSNSFLFSNELNIEFKDSIHGSFTTFSVDNFNNIYLVKADELIKLNSDFDTLFTGSSKLVIPNYIESSKNFRILLFDKERGQVQFLDNTLTKLTESFDLYSLDIVQPLLVCESFNGNNFWVLDGGNLRLLKINEKFEIVDQIENINSFSKNNGTPTQIKEMNDRLYILFPNEFILVFDVFGSYIKRIPFSGNSFNIQNNILVSKNKETFKFITLPFLEVEYILDIKLPNIKEYKWVDDRFYFRSNTAFSVYLLNQKK